MYQDCAHGIQNMMSEKAAILPIRMNFVLLLIPLLRNEIIPHNYTSDGKGLYPLLFT